MVHGRKISILTEPREGSDRAARFSWIAGTSFFVNLFVIYTTIWFYAHRIAGAGNLLILWQGRAGCRFTSETGPVGSCGEHGSTHNEISCHLHRTVDLELFSSFAMDIINKDKLCTQPIERLAKLVSALFICTKGITSLATRSKKSSVHAFMLDTVLSCSPAPGVSSRWSDEPLLQSHPQT
jgi:hypothetical protein